MCVNAISFIAVPLEFHCQSMVPVKQILADDWADASIIYITAFVFYKVEKTLFPPPFWTCGINM